MKQTKETSDRNKWRIEEIHYHNPYSKMETNWAALLGAFIFVIGIFAGLKVPVLFSISLFGIVFGLISIFRKGKAIRKNWLKVEAKCIDREWKNVIAGAGGGQRTWSFRLLCSYEFGGEQYSVTPKYWSSFISEEKLQKFLNQVISPEGRCDLWINSKNPLQTELFSNDSKDFLLHKHKDKNA